MNLRTSILFPLALSATLFACATRPFDLKDQALQANLTERSMVAGGFTLQAWQREAADSSVVPYQFIYIEGDGRPWVNGGRTPAADPTPVHAAAFAMLRHSAAGGYYLTRPCYFGNRDQQCAVSWWTDARYSAEVVHALSVAVSQWSEPGRPVVLVGYSGGGALAMLVAGQVTNVAAVVTVAGLLDTDAWTDFHRYDRLHRSLNPANITLPDAVLQIHLAGGKDRNIPIAQSRLALAGDREGSLWEYENFDHVCCWVDEWPRIEARIVAELDRRQPPL